MVDEYWSIVVCILCFIVFDTRNDIFSVLRPELVFELLVHIFNDIYLLVGGQFVEFFD